MNKMKPITAVKEQISDIINREIEKTRKEIEELDSNGKIKE